MESPEYKMSVNSFNAFVLNSSTDEFHLTNYCKLFLIGLILSLVHLPKSHLFTHLRNFWEEADEQNRSSNTQMNLMSFIKFYHGNYIESI